MKAAFASIQSDDTNEVLLKLCERFSKDNNVEAGKEALSYLASRGHGVPREIGEQSIDLVVRQTSIEDAGLRDSLVANLLQHCFGARIYLAERLRGSVTTAFKEIFEIGDNSANGIASVVLDPAAWLSEATRKKNIEDVFQLLMAKFMESGHDHNGRALKGIAKLLVSDAGKVHLLMDEESFDAILSSLDNRLPAEIRSQATLGTAKYLEISKERGHDQLTKFITMRVTRHTDDDLVAAFSAAASVFPLVPTIASTLFLSEGFVPSLASTLETETKSREVEQAALEMLNAACIDSGCREAIAKHCLRWLHLILRTGQDSRQGEAAVIVAKVKGVGTLDVRSSKIEDPNRGVTDVLPLFEKLLLKGSDTDRQTSVEGLAFASTDPTIKEAIVKNKELLKRLTSIPAETGSKVTVGPKSNTASEDPLVLTTAFGTLSILDNLTRFLPGISEEQKRLSQLKAYSNASTEAKPNPLDDDFHVSLRGVRVLEAKGVPYMINVEKLSKPKGLLPTSLALIARILFSLSKEAPNRGKLVQQGAVSLLKQIYDTANMEEQGRRTAAHALARILISVDPALVTKDFAGSIVAKVVTLLDDANAEDSDGPRDLLPKFEALLALTNLASNPSLRAGEQIVKYASDKVEDLLLSNNPLIQRGATELVCNLMAFPIGLEKFADGSKAADRRLHILLALADVEDDATRRAAGGALAMATEFPDVVKSILGRERGIKILLGLCGDNDLGCVHRGVVCVTNVAGTEGEIGIKACEAVKAQNGAEVLKGVVMGAQDLNVKGCAVDALKLLNGR